MNFGRERSEWDREDDILILETQQLHILWDELRYTEFSMQPSLSEWGNVDIPSSYEQILITKTICIKQRPYAVTELQIQRKYLNESTGTLTVIIRYNVSISSMQGNSLAVTNDKV